MAENHPTPQHHFVIHVDGREFKVDKTSMSGAEIKALVSKDSPYQLFQETAGGHDKPISDTEQVPIHSGEKFYTVPPATLGWQWT